MKKQTTTSHIDLTLRPYQIEIANYLTMQPHACLSVGMGLGKTAAVLHFLDYTLNRYPFATILIVAPKRVAETVWRQEAEKWQLWRVVRNMELIEGTPEQKQQTANGLAPIKIISRDNLKYVQDKDFTILVIDELTSFKNIKAARTKYLNTIKAQRKIGMTGTFAPNGLIDIYAQLAVLDIASNNIRDFYAWRGRWFYDRNAGSPLPFQDFKLRAGTNIDDIIAEWKPNIKTLTTDDYLKLPPIQYQNISVELSNKESKAYADLSAFLAFNLPNDMETLTIDEKAKFAKLQTLCSGFVYSPDDGTAVRISDTSTKITAAVEFCRHAAAEGEQVLLFYQYRETALWFGEDAKKEGLNIKSVKGNSYDWLTAWNNHEVDVLVANPASAGHGLNLQQGGHIILWLELTYNYEYFAQANARLYRTGQTLPVQVWFLTAHNTIDDAIFPKLRNKDKENKQIENLTK